MSENVKRKKQARLLRILRKIHRSTGAMLFVFFLFVSITGLMLGWKKHSNGYILPKSYQGTSTELGEWLPLDSLHKNACRILHDSVSKDLSTKLERIDIRKDIGMLKFVFADEYWGIQLDGKTGQLLLILLRTFTMAQYLITFSEQAKNKSNLSILPLWVWRY